MFVVALTGTDPLARKAIEYLRDEYNAFLGRFSPDSRFMAMPQVQSLQQLRRDPHILSWFTFLRSRQPPLATVTYTIHLFHLRRMLEELAWTQDLPGLAHLRVSHPHGFTSGMPKTAHIESL